VIVFGFTHCPDVDGPLFEISEVLKAMGKDADGECLFRLGRSERDTGRR